ncbi:hypothetical protein SAY87_028628 [Trapa incisa]|uniref:Uncharacterized protein n=1 Tax=Trapa incisa TaxID=236973 RepID=A0AAN7KY56_9MYRT|nr:hypothetical protein SAY87_028628 [Trapa incisa]
MPPFSSKPLKRNPPADLLPYLVPRELPLHHLGLYWRSPCTRLCVPPTSPFCSVMSKFALPRDDQRFAAELGALKRHLSPGDNFYTDGKREADVDAFTIEDYGLDQGIRWPFITEDDMNRLPCCFQVLKRLLCISYPSVISEFFCAPRSGSCRSWLLGGYLKLLALVSGDSSTVPARLIGGLGDRN